jgi:hypothetical protein
MWLVVPPRFFRYRHPRPALRDAPRPPIRIETLAQPVQRTFVSGGEPALADTLDKRWYPPVGNRDDEAAAAVEAPQHAFEHPAGLRRTLADRARRRHGGGADHPAENGAPQARDAFTVRPQAARQPGVRIQIGVDADQPEGRARPTWARFASGSKRRNRKKATASPVLYDLMETAPD